MEFWGWLYQQFIRFMVLLKRGSDPITKSDPIIDIMIIMGSDGLLMVIPLECNKLHAPAATLRYDHSNLCMQHSDRGGDCRGRTGFTCFQKN